MNYLTCSQQRRVETSVYLLTNDSFNSALYCIQVVSYTSTVAVASDSTVPVIATAYDAHLPWTRNMQGSNLGAQKERAWQRKAGLPAVTDNTQQARAGQTSNLPTPPRDSTPLRDTPSLKGQRACTHHDEVARRCVLPMLRQAHRRDPSVARLGGSPEEFRT